VDGRGVEAPADWASLRSPENYLGSARTENLVSGEGAESFPENLRLNQWALSGDWTVRRHAVVLNRGGGRIAYRFHARDLHLVMAPTMRGESARFRVHIDGEPPGAVHGIDVDAAGDGTLTAPRLYQLVRHPGRVTDRTSTSPSSTPASGPTPSRSADLTS
jgi:hypothetical protein